LKLAVIIFLIFTCAFLDAFCDSVKDLKTHFGDAGDANGRVGHPYRDAWHLAKLGARAALFAIAIMLDRLFSRRSKKTSLQHQPPNSVIIAAVVFALIGGYLVWQQTYSNPELWLSIDNSLHISTGIHWLDKFLGLHW